MFLHGKPAAAREACVVPDPETGKKDRLCGGIFPPTPDWCWQSRQPETGKGS